MIGTVKDMGTRNAGSQDTLRLFNRALEVLASPAPESEQELLDLVKKAKRDADKDHPPAPTAVKKPSRRGVAEVKDFQALGHRPSPGALTADHGSGQQSGSGSEGGTSNSTTVNSGSIGHAQARLMNVIRSGPGRGRIDKPKRKGTR
ncbi:unnamed protein product [Sphagnum troendelagicum]|uniref:Uncharacterized protein n=1 Tax=Sphagnum troendelagicum TaxID=128251 RepID=A0ABP0T7Z3_9BRYO